MATMTAVGDDTLQTLSTDELHRRFADIASVLVARLGAENPVECTQGHSGVIGVFLPTRKNNGWETDAEALRKAKERLKLAPDRFVDADEFLRRFDD